ncbi:MAG TPA: shikimate kinase [Patescibacteria group bacterium]|nr:shikimate kinase [Patescibacteria group bacterium]
MANKNVHKKTNIVLIGFMGSGKTVLAEMLAKKLKMEFVEMNDLVLKKSGRKSINDIFDKDGEPHFRELEIEVAKDLRKIDHSVIAAGGGIIVNKLVVDYLRENGYIIYLRVGFNEAKKRLRNFHDRPNFRDPRYARRLYNFRKTLYRAYADDYVRTDKKTLEEVADEIIELIKDDE